MGSYLSWALEVLKDMISIPTVNPPGDKFREFTQYAKEVLKSIGFRVEEIEVPRSYVERFYPEYAGHPRYIVLGRIGEGEPIVHFNGHYDVVPAGTGWTVDPFDPVVKDGKVYGRGACDMKGGIASFLAAIKSFVETQGSFEGTIEVALVPDEEIGGITGTGYLVKEVGIRPSYAIIGEPSGVGSVWIGHRGIVWALIEVHGKQAHGSTPWLGVNAFEYMVLVAEKLIKEYKPMLEAKVSKYEYDDPRGAKPTASIGGEVKGGVKVNVIPAYCAFSVDRRLIIEEKVEEVEKELVDFVKKASSGLPDVKVEVKIINKSPPAITDPNSKLVKLAKEACNEVLGYEPRAIICLGGLDMRYYLEANVEAITYGPGLAAFAHMADEFLFINDLEYSTKVYYRLLSKLLKAK